MPKSAAREEDTRFRVLCRLGAEPHKTQRQLADELSVSLGKVNSYLRAMAAADLLKRQPLILPDNRLKYVYVLTPSGIAEQARLSCRCLRRKMDEHARLGAEIELLQRDIAKLRRKN